jgi:hypothetical protein
MVHFVSLQASATLSNSQFFHWVYCEGGSRRKEYAPRVLRVRQIISFITDKNDGGFEKTQTLFLYEARASCGGVCLVRTTST